MAGTVLAGQKLAAVLLGVPPWTGMTLINSWTNFGGGSVTCQYRLWKLLNSVEVIGALATAGHSSATFFTLPAGYIPASLQQFAAGSTAGGASMTNMCGIQCDSSGNLSVQAIPASATIVDFHGWISLDA